MLEGEGMYVFVEFYVSAVMDEDRSPRDLRPSRIAANDLSVVNRYNNLALVQADPDPTSRYDLVDVSSIQHGLWVEKDPTSPEKLWVVSFLDN